MSKILISGLILSLAATGMAQQRYRVVGSSVSIHSSRPMDAAAEFVREHYGIPVSYEDPKTQFSADILDETDESYRRQNPSVRALVQKRGTIEVSFGNEYSDGGEKKRAALRFLQAAAREHIAQGNNGNFEILEDPLGLVVVPRMARGRRGELQAQQSPLDSKITIAPEKLTAERCLDLVVAAASKASGETIKLGLLPSNYLTQIEGTCEAANQPARDVLRRVLYFPRIVSFGQPGQSAAPRPAFVWHLLYGIANDDYVLSVTPAVQVQKSRFGDYESREILVTP